MSLHIIAEATNPSGSPIGLWVYDTEKKTKEIHSMGSIARIMHNGGIIYGIKCRDWFRREEIIWAPGAVPRVSTDGCIWSYNESYNNYVLISALVAKDGNIRECIMSNGRECDIRMSWEKTLSYAHVNRIINVKSVRKNNKWYISAIKGSIERIKI